MCTYPVQPICTFSCTSVFILIFINPQYTVLHIYLIAHLTPYLFLFSFSPIFIYIYIYILFCYISLLFFVISIIIIYLFCTFHWADLSWLTFHYWLYPVWLCMWQIIKNLEPWKAPNELFNVQKSYNISWWAAKIFINSLKILINTVKYFLILKQRFSILIYFEIWFIPAIAMLNFQQPLFQSLLLSYRNYSNMLNWSTRTISYYVEDSCDTDL